MSSEAVSDTAPTSAPPFDERTRASQRGMASHETQRMKPSRLSVNEFDAQCQLRLSVDIGLWSYRVTAPTDAVWRTRRSVMSARSPCLTTAGIHPPNVAARARQEVRSRAFEARGAGRPSLSALSSVLVGSSRSSWQRSSSGFDEVTYGAPHTDAPTLKTYTGS